MRVAMASLLLGALAFPALHAQAIGTATSGIIDSTGYGKNLHQANDPYTLIVEYKTVRTLADGTHLTTTRRESIYRDNLGRTRIENENSSIGGSRFTFHTITVYDGVGGHTYFWTQNLNATTHEYFMRDIAAGLHHPAIVNGSRLLKDASQPAGVPPHPVTPTPSGTPPLRAKNSTEDLGMHDVHGFSCKAQRITTTYPVDFFGNDRPIVVTSETCFSQEVAHDLEQQRDDPRSGTEAMTVQSLTHGEPDASLFQPPAGYTEHHEQRQIP